jgi:iron complex outermembrane recepter protein
MPARNRSPLIALTAALTLAQAQVFAEETDPPGGSDATPGEIVVTSQWREEKLQDVPIAITALSGRDLQNRGVTNLTGIAESSTSINFAPYPSSNNLLLLYMRGLGVADPGQITQDSSVGIYEDGFYIGRPQIATFDLADVERVEVLRGPQGTLYGRNTTGGAINLISQKPTGELDFKASGTLGTREDGRALGVINLPKIVGISAKVTLLASNLDGDVKNPARGSDFQDFGIQRQVAAKLQLRYEAGNPFTADYFFEHYDNDSTPEYWQNAQLSGLLPGYTGSPTSTAYEPTPLPLSDSTSNAQGLTLGIQWNDSTSFKSLTGYRTLYSNGYQNFANSFTTAAAFAFEGTTGVTSQDVVHSIEFTQEFQLVGNIGPQLDYALGLYYYREGANHLQDGLISLPMILLQELTDRYVVAEAKSRAAYGQTTWKIPGFDAKLSLTTGVRYTQDTRQATRDDAMTILGLGTVASEEGASNHQRFGKFEPMGTLAYAWSSDLNTYFRIASGYKSGGSSEAAPIGEFGVTYGPETVTQYELGLKSYWLDRTVRVDVAAFYSDIRNLQLPIPIDPADPSIVLTLNAGAATIRGVEWEALYQPLDALALTLNWTYLNSQIGQVKALAGTAFDPAVNPASPYTVNQNVASLFQLPFAPRTVFDVATDYTFLHANNGAYSLQLNYRYQQRQYESAAAGAGVPNSTEFYSVPGFGTLDARVTWRAELSNQKQLRVSLWGKNVTDLRYKQEVIGQGELLPVPGTPRAGYSGAELAYAAPALYGIDFSYGF